MNKSTPPRTGFTLVEMVIAGGLIAMVLLMAASWFRSGGLFFQKTQSIHELELETWDAANLISGLLRRADPASIEIQSAPGVPWGRLKFAAGSHAYDIYAEKGSLLMITDSSQTKVLSAHIQAIQFAVSRVNLPTLLTWTLRLSHGTDLLAVQTSISGMQYLERPAE